MKEGFLNIKCSTIKNMAHNCTPEEFMKVLDMAVDYVSDGVDHRADAPKGIIRMMLYSVTDDIDFFKSSSRKEYHQQYDAERYQRQKAEKMEKMEKANSNNSNNSNFSNNSNTLNKIELNKIEQNKTNVVCSAPAREEVEKYFQTNKQTTNEWLKFYEFNEAHGWKCLPNWKGMAVRWIELIKQTKAKENIPVGEFGNSFNTDEFVQKNLERVFGEWRGDLPL